MRAISGELQPRAGARQAQSNLRNGLTNAKVIYTDSDSYLAATPETLNEAEPSLDFVARPTDPGLRARGRPTA